MRRKNKFRKWVVIVGSAIIVGGLSFFYLSSSNTKISPRWKINWHRERKQPSTPEVKQPSISVSNKKKRVVEITISPDFSIPKEINIYTKQELKFTNQTKDKLILADKDNYLSNMTLKPGESKIISFYEPLEVSYTISKSSSKKVYSGIIRVR